MSTDAKPPLAGATGSAEVTYSHTCELIEQMPKTWLGGILITVVTQCVRRKFFRTHEDLLHFVGKIAADAQPPNAPASATGSQEVKHEV